MLVRTADDYARALQAASAPREAEHLVQDLLAYCRQLEQEAKEFTDTARRIVFAGDTA